jgi:hypothetical protein
MGFVGGFFGIMAAFGLLFVFAFDAFGGDDDDS